MSKYGDKYPWLKRRDVNDYFDDEEDNWDWMNDMPEGWRIAFGDLFVEELDAAIKAEGLEDEYLVLQVKEKHGTLRWYDYASSKKINDIVEKYSLLSGHICMNCGTIDIPMLSFGWLAPLCKDCYEKHINCTKTYEEVVVGESTMPNARAYRKFSHEFDPKGWKDFEVDISDTVRKIRELYTERMAAGFEANSCTWTEN